MKESNSSNNNYLLTKSEFLELEKISKSFSWLDTRLDFFSNKIGLTNLCMLIIYFRKKEAKQKQLLSINNKIDKRLSKVSKINTLKEQSNYFAVSSDSINILSNTKFFNTLQKSENFVNNLVSDKKLDIISKKQIINKKDKRVSYYYYLNDNSFILIEEN